MILKQKLPTVSTVVFHTPFFLFFLSTWYLDHYIIMFFGLVVTLLLLYLRLYPMFMFCSSVLPFSLSLFHILLCVQVASASVVTEGGAALNRITWTQSGVHVAAGETFSFM
jgi:hypothetical protein